MNDLLCFVHIPKTGGTSFKKSCLLPNFHDSEVYQFQGFKKLLLTPPTESTNLIVGHCSYGIHRLIWNRQVRERIAYCTILREPVDRCISNYYFIRQGDYPNYKHPNLPDAKRYSLVEFYRIPKYQNRQTKFIAGFPAAKVLGAYSGSLGDRRLLEVAKSNLERQFDSFGLLECLSDYQAWFCERYGFANANVRDTDKTTKVRPRIDELTAVEAEEILQSNHLDYQLYEYARNLYWARYLKSASKNSLA